MGGGASKAKKKGVVKVTEVLYDTKTGRRNDVILDKKPKPVLKNQMSLRSKIQARVKAVRSLRELLSAHINDEAAAFREKLAAELAQTLGDDRARVMQMLRDQAKAAEAEAEAHKLTKEEAGESGVLLSNGKEADINATLLLAINKANSISEEECARMDATSPHYLAPPAPHRAPGAPTATIVETEGVPTGLVDAEARACIASGKLCYLFVVESRYDAVAAAMKGKDATKAAVEGPVDGLPAFLRDPAEYDGGLAKRPLSLVGRQLAALSLALDRVQGGAPKEAWVVVCVPSDRGTALIELLRYYDYFGFDPLHIMIQPIPQLPGYMPSEEGSDFQLCFSSAPRSYGGGYALAQLVLPRQAYAMRPHRSSPENKLGVDHLHGSVMATLEENSIKWMQVTRGDDAMRVKAEYAVDINALCRCLESEKGGGCGVAMEVDTAGMTPRESADILSWASGDAPSTSRVVSKLRFVTKPGFEVTKRLSQSSKSGQYATPTGRMIFAVSPLHDALKAGRARAPLLITTPQGVVFPQFLLEEVTLSPKLKTVIYSRGKKCQVAFPSASNIAASILTGEYARRARGACQAQDKDADHLPRLLEFEESAQEEMRADSGALFERPPPPRPLNHAPRMRVTVIAGGDVASVVAFHHTIREVALPGVDVVEVCYAVKDASQQELSQAYRRLELYESDAPPCAEVVRNMLACSPGEGVVETLAAYAMTTSGRSASAQKKSMASPRADGEGARQPMALIVCGAASPGCHMAHPPEPLPGSIGRALIRSSALPVLMVPADSQPGEVAYAPWGEEVDPEKRFDNAKQFTTTDGLTVGNVTSVAVAVQGPQSIELVKFLCSAILKTAKGAASGSIPQVLLVSAGAPEETEEGRMLRLRLIEGLRSECVYHGVPAVRADADEDEHSATRAVTQLVRERRIGMATVMAPHVDPSAKTKLPEDIDEMVHACRQYGIKLLVHR